MSLRLVTIASSLIFLIGCNTGINEFNVTVLVTLGEYPSSTASYFEDSSSARLHGEWYGSFTAQETVTNVYQFTYNNDSAANCYTYFLTSFDDNVVGFDFVRPSYYFLFSNEGVLSLKGQTHSYEYDFCSSVYCVRLYFCADLFNTWNKYASNNNNNLSIAFESFPTGLKLQITNTDENIIYYSNSFDAVAAHEKVWSNEYNQSLEFRGIKSGCYEIIFMDSDFDAIESSLNHVNYIIYLNDTVVNYGGYFAESETNAFCTSDDYFCVTPYDCQNARFSSEIDGEELQFASYKCYFNTYFSMMTDCTIYCEGSYSFENGVIGSIIMIFEYTILNCNGLFSCLNVTLSNIVSVFKGISINCNGFHSCDSIKPKISSSQPNTEFVFSWYVNFPSDHIAIAINVLTLRA